MSSLQFTSTPPRPDHIAADVWEKEWVGLCVGLASIFPRTVGYLGEGKRRIFDNTTKLYRDPTSHDSMDYLTNVLGEPLWISRSALMHACLYSVPPRPTILSWLDEESQRGRDVFAVPESIAVYIP